MKQISWYRSIRFRIPAVIALVLLVPIVVFWHYSMELTRKNMLSQTSNLIYTNLYGASLLMDDVMEQVSDFSREISQDPGFLSLISQYQQADAGSDQRQKARSQLSLALSQYVGQLRTLDSIYLMFPETETVVTMLPGQKELSFSHHYAQQLYQMYYDVFESPIVWHLLPSAGGGSRMLSHIRPVSGPAQQEKCILICNLKDSAWQTALSALELYSGSVWISNYAGQVLLSYGSTLSTSQNIGQDSRFSQAFAQNRQSGTYSYQEDGTDYLISYYNAVESGWKYLSCVPEDIVLSGSGGARAFSLLALLCGALGISLGSLILYRYVVRPISALMSHLSDMEQGTLAQAPVPVQRDEISLLFHRYNQMIQRLQKLIDEIYVQQLLRKQAELSFLQSQMDEHFLYNTLNTIYSQASHEHADTSARMILTLSRYFRISLSQGSDKLPLDQLADLLRSYLQLQQMRFGRSLVFQIQRFPEMEQFVALKYLFQPIVENSIVHGFEKRPAQHRIEITFQKEGDMLFFQVADDGIGISPQDLGPLLRQINGEGPIQGRSFALRNIHEQLCIAYGPRDIHIESRPGAGTRVFFRIPLERREPHV